MSKLKLKKKITYIHIFVNSYILRTYVHTCKEGKNLLTYLDILHSIDFSTKNVGKVCQDQNSCVKFAVYLPLTLSS